MAKSTSKSYTLEIPLITSETDEKILESRFNVIHHMTNVLIKHARKAINGMYNDPQYKKLIGIYKERTLTADEKKQLSDIRLQYGLSEYQFMHYIGKLNKQYPQIGYDVTSGVARKVWSGTQKVLFENGKFLHFKKKEEVNSYESVHATNCIIYKDGYINNKGLKIKLQVSYRNKQVLYTLKDVDNGKIRVKYCRIIRRFIKNKYKYYTQLVLEGTPEGKNKPKPNNKTVGIDIGPSTIAVVSDKKVILRELAEGIENIDSEIRILQRKLDRQRRANNPDNFNEDGTVKAGKKTWIKSNQMIITQNKLRDLQRKRAARVKQSHCALANEIIKLGNNVIVEDMNWSALSKRAQKTEKNEKGKFKKKKRFGKSVSNHAPSLLISIINQKLGYIGKKVEKVDCFKTAASQFDHTTGVNTKHELNERNIQIGKYTLQRDLHAAYNLKHIIKKKDGSYEYEIDAMNKDFKKFIKLHNQCIDELKINKANGQKLASSFGI